MVDTSGCIRPRLPLLRRGVSELMIRQIRECQNEHDYLVFVVLQLNESKPPDLHDPPMRLNYGHTFGIRANKIFRATNASHTVHYKTRTSLNTTAPLECRPT